MTPIIVEGTVHLETLMQRLRRFCAVIPTLMLITGATPGMPAGDAPAQPPPALMPFLTQHCMDCHDADSAKGGLNLAALPMTGDRTHQAQWTRVYERVAAGEMPPPKKSRPDAASLKAFLNAVDASLSEQHRQTKGHTLRRLTRTEYENTLRDLFGVRPEISDLLPEEGTVQGFDSVAEAQGFSAIHLRQMLDAADAALDAVEPAAPPAATTHTFSLADTRAAKTGLGKQWLKRDDGAVVLFGSGFPIAEFDQITVPAGGWYRVRLTVAAHASTVPVAYELVVGRRNEARSEAFDEAPSTGAVRERTVWMRPGETIRVTPVLTPKPGQQKLEAAAKTDPGLAISSLELHGPLADARMTAGRRLLYGDLATSPATRPAGGPRNGRPARQAPPRHEVISERPDTDGPRLLRGLAEALFRRPVTDADVASFNALFAAELRAGRSFAASLRSAQLALLTAPDFVYMSAAKRDATRLDHAAVATRLAYFLTRSAPDAELRAAAAAQTLGNADVLRQHTQRLLSDPRFERFCIDFCAGWLNLRAIHDTAPDRRLYPEYDAFLEHSMLGESRAFFAELIRANLPVRSLVISDFAMLNSRLAQHYDIAGVTGSEIRRVALPAGSVRGGVLAQASVLKVTANGTTTSPVMRGVWVLDRLLGEHPPPPPPGTPGLEPDTRGSTTIREQLAKHRQLEQCAGCHRRIDPPGFALESFDPIGGWRTQYRIFGNAGGKERRPGNTTRPGPAVDASGDLLGRGAFADYLAFRNLLADEQRRIASNLLQRLLTFATGREMGFSDRAEITAILDRLQPSGWCVRDLMVAVVTSDIFQQP